MDNKPANTWKIDRMFDEVKRFDSSDTNVFKYVFTTDNAVAEAVLYRYQSFLERTVICCSTQSGCPIGCRFCGTGDHFVRNLTADEIVFQTEFMLKEMDIDSERIKNFQIMFMSMGEPMLNFKNLEIAIRKLNELYPQAKLLISTSAPDVDYQPVIDLSVEIDKVGLQFSAHESTDEKRNALVPFKNKLTLQQMGEQGTKWYEATSRRPFFNYCAHEGNNTQEDVNRLVKLFDPTIWENTTSVICERDESVHASNIRQQEMASGFMSKLLTAGYSCRMFDPAGQDDIGGGCGQLWFVQDWMKSHPEKARPTAGTGKAKVHSPQEEVTC